MSGRGPMMISGLRTHADLRRFEPRKDRLVVVPKQRETQIIRRRFERMMLWMDEGGPWARNIGKRQDGLARGTAMERGGLSG